VRRGGSTFVVVTGAALLVWGLIDAAGAGAQEAVAYANGNPTWSPDGLHVAFEGVRGGDRDIFVADADGSNVRSLTAVAWPEGGSLERHPSWTPDGTRIVFDSDRTGNAELYSMAADGTDVVRLTDHPAIDLVPVPSPDGRSLAFNSMRDGQWDVYVLDSSNGELRNLTSHAATDIVRSWSRDGEFLQFDSDRATEPGGRRQGYVIRPDGSGLDRITTSGADDRFLRRGPPGTDSVAFTSTRGGTRGIWLAARDGSGLRVVYDGPGADQFPTWSPDGRWIVFASDEEVFEDLWVIAADRSERRRFLRQ
jgi:TolB protein